MIVTYCYLVLQITLFSQASVGGISNFEKVEIFTRYFHDIALLEKAWEFDIDINYMQLYGKRLFLCFVSIFPFHIHSQNLWK